MSEKDIIKWLNQISKMLENHTSMGSILAKEKVEKLIKNIKNKND